MDKKSESTDVDASCEEVKLSSQDASSEQGQPEGLQGQFDECQVLKEDDEMQVLKEERDQYLGLAQRTQADFENFRKRTTRDIEAATQRVQAGIFKDIIPLVDNLERALAVIPEDVQYVQDGVRMVHAELIKMLETRHVVSIDPQGESFDPNRHEAISVLASEGSESGTVVEVVTKGYMFQETVLRPAQVIVAA